MMLNLFKREKSSDKEVSIYSSYGARQDKRSIVKLSGNRVFEYNLLNRDKENINTAYFRNGFLYDVYPCDNGLTIDENRHIAYNARYIILDGKKFDLCNPKDVISIKIPNFKKGTSSFSYVTRNLAYIMKIKAQKIYQAELAVPTVFTTVNLMLVSEIGWLPKDYNRMISQLERLEEYEYASILKESIKRFDSSLIDNCTGYFDNVWDDESTRKYAKRVIEYEWIVDKLPELAPKSLNGYTRMKHNNSKNYIRIKEKAKEIGYELDDTL